MPALHQCGLDRGRAIAFAPEAAAIKAGRLMLKEIAECVRRGDRFALKTHKRGLMQQLFPSSAEADA